MKKVIILSHCILNPYCELDEPSALSLYQQAIRTIVNKGIGILQLPCPELCYQGLERASITGKDSRAADYRAYCREILSPTIKNIVEYHKNGVELVKIVGIDTSPSCSTEDPSSIMIKELVQMMEEKGIFVSTIDMPQDPDINKEDFLKRII